MRTEIDPRSIKMSVNSSVFRGMRPCPHPPSERPKIFLTRHTVKNGISNLCILLKCALKMQEMPFQRPKIQKKNGEACHRTPLAPYNCVVTMASPSIKSWLRYWVWTLSQSELRSISDRSNFRSILVWTAPIMVDFVCIYLYYITSCLDTFLRRSVHVFVGKT